MDRIELEVEAHQLAEAMTKFEEWKIAAEKPFEEEILALAASERSEGDKDLNTEQSETSWASWMWWWWPWRKHKETEAEKLVASTELLDFKLAVEHQLSTFEVQSRELAARVRALYELPRVLAAWLFFALTW